ALHDKGFRRCEDAARRGLRNDSRRLDGIEESACASVADRNLAALDADLRVAHAGGEQRRKQMLGGGDRSAVATDNGRTRRVDNVLGGRGYPGGSFPVDERKRDARVGLCRQYVDDGVRTRVKSDALQVDRFAQRLLFVHCGSSLPRRRSSASTRATSFGS